MAKKRLSDIYLDPDRDMRRHLAFDLGHIARAIGKARGDVEPGVFAREEAQAAILAVTELQRRAKRDKRYFMVSKNVIRTRAGRQIELRPAGLYRLRSGSHARYMGPEPSDPWVPMAREHRFEIVTGRQNGRTIAVRFDGSHCDPEDDEPNPLDIVGAVR